MRTSKKIVSLVLAVMMLASMIVVGTVSASAAGVAVINGTTSYGTFKEALDAAIDGDIITLLANCDGDGWVAPQGKFNTNGLTVDFGGFTYTVSGTPVGSTGTETSAFQLLKDNKITFENGTIYADCTVNPRDGKNLQRMIQNYSDLTLDGMTVSMKGAYYDQITVATCNGKTTIKNSTINEPDFSDLGYASSSRLGGAAIEMGTFGSYPSIDVTVEGSTINGNFNVSDDNNAANFSLDFTNSTVNGEVVLDADAQAAVDASPSTATVDTTGATQNVAKIGDTYYTTLEAAFAAAQDGNRIDVLADCNGNGIQILPNRFPTDLLVDFNGHTYTMDGDPTGSTGTKTQAFQLQMNNNIRFWNGTIYSEKAKLLIQNYSNLVLGNMTLTLDNPNYASAYTLSNNNGDSIIYNSTINANPAGGFAFDVCRGGGSDTYPSVHVTVSGNSTINGDVEIYAKNGDAKDGFGLNLVNGTLTGDIVLTPQAEAAMEATPAKVEISKKDAFDQAAPAGYKWVSNGAGKSTLEPADLYAQIEGYQNKAKQADAEGNGVRILTKVDKSAFTDADSYGYVVAKVTGKDQATAKFANLKKDGGNGEKTIDCTGTFNNGIDNIDNTYVTLAVNGMSNNDQVAVRFYYIKDGVTYYAKYVNTISYDGIIATYKA